MVCCMCWRRPGESHCVRRLTRTWRPSGRACSSRGTPIVGLPRLRAMRALMWFGSQTHLVAVIRSLVYRGLQLLLFVPAPPNSSKAQVAEPTMNGISVTLRAPMGPELEAAHPSHLPVPQLPYLGSATSSSMR
eukprot:jgi/Botrbrau1/17211/Bobra.0620s0001.1